MKKVTIEEIEKQYNKVVSNVYDYLKTKSKDESGIYQAVYDWCVYADWYCNDEFPEGERLIDSKDKILLKHLTNTFPCFETSCFKEALCSKCKCRFNCLTGNVSRETLKNTIESAVQEEMVDMCVGEFDDTTISQTDFEKRKRTLFDYLGMDVNQH